MGLAFEPPEKAKGCVILGFDLVDFKYPVRTDLHAALFSFALAEVDDRPESPRLCPST